MIKLTTPSMCGIAGILETDRGAKVDPELLRRMCAAMLHRGPDDEGIYIQAGIGLGVRRLSIIDVATGHQPISNEDGSLWVVLNGEIYNQRVLREDLIACGHRFRTRCDTEVIVHLYEEYRRDCVRYLRGMFAFAIWDSRRQTLFIARDRLGIKPLYYQLNAKRFLFGSEIKVLLAHPEVHAVFRRTVLPEYLAFGFLSGPETFYQGIDKLLPAHWLEVNQQGELQTGQYWDVCPAANSPSCDESYYVGTYRKLLEAAVESHLMSDVPVGVFLSGGLDSSAVAAVMTQVRQSPIETFSVGYDEDTYSELEHARAVATHLSSRHHEVLVSRDEFFAALPRLIWHEDEPITWPSSVALYFVARLARQSVTVVLTGEGSDETLAGYTRYPFTLRNAEWDGVYRTLVPPLMRRRIRRLISESNWINADLRRKLAHSFMAKDGNTWSSLYFDNFLCAFSEADQAALLTDETAQLMDNGASYRRVLEYWEHASGTMLRRMLYTDIKTYLVELLMKQDNMSMAASIESRVPFLDHELVEFALSVPQNFSVKGLAGKQILKKAMADLLPQSTIYRTKLGFPTPWESWLAGPQLDVIQELLLQKRSLERGLFDPVGVRRIFAEHRSRRRDHRDRIWRLLNLELWQRVCLEGASSHSTAREFEAVELPTGS